jgi:biofilm PGA synthesis N-glycosyltransferase PgaC
MTTDNYCLVTAARNEQHLIAHTVRSVASQTVLPARWVIVSDSSSDDTDEVVASLAQEYHFITFVRRSEESATRSFGSKVHAFRLGCQYLGPLAYGFIGNLDADVTFAPDYFERLLQRFRANSRLGVGGGIIQELIGKRFIAQRISRNSVAGAVQLFRRECYEQIGGYVPLRYGGIDSAIEIMARMRGWEVETFPELPVRHHRRVASGSGSMFKREWRHGLRHYDLGYYPLFELLRNVYRLSERPYVIGAALMSLGYLWALATCKPRELPEDVVRYFEEEQKQRLISMLLNSTPRNSSAHERAASRQ